MRSVLRAIASLLFAMCIVIIATGQSLVTTKPDFSMRVHPGEPVPDVVFGSVNNWNDKPVRFSDFRGKLLILDFWTTNCSPCIAAMPKMEALQQSFQNQVQVILVTKNSKKAVAKLTERSKILQRNTLPTITDDTLLGKLFPYTGTPTHVWIGKDGKLLFVTGGYNTTQETVQKYLNGSTLAIKHEELQPGADIDIAAAFTNSEKLDLRCYSVFTGRSKITSQGLNGPLRDAANNVVGYKAQNVDLYGLLTTQFLKDDNFDKGLYWPNRVVWNVKNKYPYIFPDNKSLQDKWRDQYLYCYELRLPKISSVEDVHYYLAEDIRRYFGVTAHLENRRVKCLVLIRTSNEDKIKTLGGKHLFHTQEDYSGFEGIDIRPLDFMIHTFGSANFKSPLPVVDGTNYAGRIDLTINADLHDLSAVRKELQKYDLDIIEREETIPMIVITEEK